MWTCPNCQHPEEDVSTCCSQCHFDGSTDDLRYPSLVSRVGQPLPAKPKPKKSVSPAPAKPKPVPVQKPSSKTSKRKAPSVSEKTFNISLDVLGESKTPAAAGKTAEPETRQTPVQTESPAKTPSPTTSTAQETSSKGTFSKRFAAVLVGAAVCIGGAALALHFHETSLPTASSVVSSAAVSVPSDASDSTAASVPTESSSAASASAASVSSKVQAYRDSKLYALSSYDPFYYESQVTYDIPSESTSLSYTQISATYQGMSYAKSITEGETQISITRDGFSYILYPSKKIMLKFAVQTSSFDLRDNDSVEQAIDNGTLVLTTSTKTIDGDTYHAETLRGKSFETLSENGTSSSYTITYCFEGDTLRYLLEDIEEGGVSSSMQIKVLRQSHDVDTSLFELPNYKVYTYNSGKFYDENGKALDYIEVD